MWKLATFKKCITGQISEIKNLSSRQKYLPDLIKVRQKMLVKMSKLVWIDKTTPTQISFEVASFKVRTKTKERRGVEI